MASETNVWTDEEVDLLLVVFAGDNSDRPRESKMPERQKCCLHESSEEIRSR